MTPKGPADMSKAEFGEPWKDGADQHNGKSILSHSEDGLGYYVGEIRNPEKRARVILCVNALAGIPHPERIPALIEACEILAKTFSPQRLYPGPIADLIDALRAVQPQQAEREAKATVTDPAERTRER